MRAIAACLLLGLVLVCQAGATTVYMDTFNGEYVSGPIGPVPAGWSMWGFGPPAYMSQETGLVLPPNDGTNSAPRVDVPGIVTWQAGTIAWTRSFRMNDWAAPGEIIDWSKPVYLKADAYGNDLGTDTKWRCWVEITNYKRSVTSIEWGNNGVQNQTWQTVVCELLPGYSDGTKTGTLYMVVDFDFQNKGFEGNNTLIFENLRVEYTPVPEPSCILSLGLGLLAGLTGAVRRRK